MIPGATEYSGLCNIKASSIAIGILFNSTPGQPFPWRINTTIGRSRRDLATRLTKTREMQENPQMYGFGSRVGVVRRQGVSSQGSDWFICLPSPASLIYGRSWNQH